MRLDFTSRRFFAPTPNTGGAPTPEDIANAEKLVNILQRQLGISEAEARIRVNNAKAQGTLNAELEVYQERMEQVAFQSDYIFRSFQETTAELKNQNVLLNLSKSATKKISDIASDINFYQRGSNDLTDKQFKKMGESLEMRENDFNTVVKRYKAENTGQQINALNAKQDIEELTSFEKKKLEVLLKEKSAYDAAKNAIEQAIPLLKQELEFSKNISQARQDLGGLATAAAGTISKYGGDLAQFLNIDAAKESVEEYNKKLIDEALKSDAVLDALHKNELERIKLEAQLEGLTGDERIAKLKEIEALSKLDLETKQKAINKVNEFGNKLGSLKVLVKGLGEGLKKSLTDPLTIITTLVSSLLTGSTGIAAFEKSLGVSYEQAYKLNTQLNFVGNNVFDAYINGEKLKKSFIDLSQSMGFVADYGNEALVTMTNLTGKLGLSNQEAAQLTTLSRMQSVNTEAVLDNVGRSVTAMNKQGKTTILLKDVMKEIANVSKATAVSLGSNPVKIAEAVVAAKQLGTTLQQMESTADSLLNFESSIEDELKAELLTGKELNLERARAAALANDMKGLSEEIGKNEEIIGAFASNNRLAQEATAKALGMNREQLAGIVYQQEAQRTSAEAVRAKYGEQAYQQLKAQDAQEKFANSVEKLKTAFSSIVQIFSPLIDGLAFVAEIVASITSQWFILYPLVGIVALSYVPKMITGFKSMIGSVASLGKGIMKAFSMDGIKGWFDKVGGALKGVTPDSSTITSSRGIKLTKKDKAKDLADKVTENAGKTDGKTEVTEKGGDGSKFKDKMKNIAEGIKAFGDGKVILGGLVGLPASAVGLIAMIPGVVGAKLIESINGPKFTESMTGLSTGISAMGTLTVTGGAANLIASAVGLIAMIPGVAGAKLIEFINGPKLSQSLSGLAIGLSAMGTPSVFLGSLGLIAASAGLIAMIPGVIGGSLLGVAGPLIQAGLTSLSVGLTAFGTAAINPMVWAGIGLLASFGAALIPLGYALKLMSPAIESFGKAIKSTFEGIGAIIIAAADGIATIFGSLENVDVMKLLAIGPALIGIGVGLAALGGGGVIGAIGDFLSGDPIEKLKGLAASGDGLQKTATALQAMAGALAGVSLALASIDVSKLNALDEFSTTQSSNSVVSGITDFITAPIKAIGEAIGGGDKEEIKSGVDLTPMIAAINEVKAAVDRLYSKDQSINMDGKKVGTTLVQNSYKAA